MPDPLIHETLYRGAEVADGRARELLNHPARPDDQPRGVAEYR